MNITRRDLEPVLMDEALRLAGYRSPASLWKLERKGLFPQRRKLGPNRVGWMRADIENWLSTRARGIGADVVPVEEPEPVTP